MPRLDVAVIDSGVARLAVRGYIRARIWQSMLKQMAAGQTSSPANDQLLLGGLEKRAGFSTSLRGCIRNCWETTSNLDLFLLKSTPLDSHAADSAPIMVVELAAAVRHGF
ncbi:hypothetical protein HBH70_006900 [Parastagonospora nodorum]|nr:hypothetical protein HBH52_038780 [Parastagonospora nodorum]KAH4060846.1 hypothetical protein HBH49_007400 [Parastagonospora nodorum]KAH4274669.1 hypothetical protein HBI03_013010 [Parastagonospora nodorum]KAH4284106.1 hypothetical protein HBI04_006930 [Parastagonospora nodorum]KAH4964753.1 hypothetical protein HBI78_101610 [Parastagonospora nodorum]